MDLLIVLKGMAVGDTMKEELDFSKLQPDMPQIETAVLIEGNLAVRKTVQYCSIELVNRIARAIQTNGSS